MYLSGAVFIAMHASLASAASVTFNETYDDPKTPASQLKCYNNGAIMPGYEWQTLGDVTTYPIGLKNIDKAESSLCASCWELEYGDKIHHFLAVDGASSDMTISRDAMKSLTGQADERLGPIEMKAQQVALLDCGFHDPPEEEL